MEDEVGSAICDGVSAGDEWRWNRGVVGR